MKERDQYCFPAKRRRWGWGPPTVWQGWVVLRGIVSANIVAALVLVPRHLVVFLCFVFGDGLADAVDLLGEGRAAGVAIGPTIVSGDVKPYPLG
jgi:hypothetical protein